MDCVWATWGDWSNCSEPCGKIGKMVRNRTKEVEEKNNGTCNGDSIEEKKCYVPCQGIICNISYKSIFLSRIAIYVCTLAKR